MKGINIVAVNAGQCGCGWIISVTKVVFVRLITKKLLFYSWWGEQKS